MLGMAVDITDRKQVEQALRHSEQDLREAQRLTKVGSWQWDPSTATASWSEELYRIAGRDPHLPALNFEEQPQLYTPESWERLQCAVQEVLRTGIPFELDLELVRPDGTTRSVIARGEAQRDTMGRIVQLRGTGQDITERKRAEDALRESENKLRLLLDSTAEAIYGIDLEGCCTFCNLALPLPHI
jgi:PAS domain S-box-containing protein